MTQRARAAAEAYRNLSRALTEAAPLQERILKEQQQVQEAGSRLLAELEGAASVCGPAPGASASAGAAPVSPTGSAPRPGAPGH